jgi:hypothetical protein
MKHTLVGSAVLALHLGVLAQGTASEDAPRAPLSLRSGAPSQLASPAPAYPRPEPVSSDPQAQVRDLRSRLEILDRRVAELEKKLAPAPSAASDKPDASRLRVNTR